MSTTAISGCRPRPGQDPARRRLIEIFRPLNKRGDVKRLEAMGWENTVVRCFLDALLLTLLPAGTGRGSDVAPMLGQRLRRCPSIGATSDPRLVLLGCHHRLRDRHLRQWLDNHTGLLPDFDPAMCKTAEWFGVFGQSQIVCITAFILYFIWLSSWKHANKKWHIIVVINWGTF